jgi:radical SAM superfamily enzyme YgiQ (UPF0313 family)
MRSLMQGKYAPCSNLEWPDLVWQGFTLMRRLGWTPITSVILGLPGESNLDLGETELLVKRMAATDYDFLFAPLLFVPIPQTRLGDAPGPRQGQLTPAQARLFRLMWKHNLRHLVAVWNVTNIQGYEFRPWQTRVLTGAIGAVRETINWFTAHSHCDG